MSRLFLFILVAWATALLMDSILPANGADVLPASAGNHHSRFEDSPVSDHHREAQQKQMLAPPSHAESAVDSHLVDVDSSSEDADLDSDEARAVLKRARKFMGKRARKFMGKRARKFMGKRARKFMG